MAEVGGQKGQLALRILAGPIPAHECSRGESVSQVMQTRAMTVAGATQTDLPGQRIKHSTNVRAIQPVARAGDEQMRGNWSLSPVAVLVAAGLRADPAGLVR